MSTFGDLLKEDRETLRWSQEQLGDALGVSQQTIAQWESDKAHPRRERRQKLLELLSRELHGRSKLVQHTDLSPVNLALYGDRLEPGVSFKRLIEDFPAAPNPHVALHQIYRRDNEEFKAALPAELHEHLGGRIGVGDMQRRLDYLSPTLAAEIKRVVMPRNALNILPASVLRLAVARRINEAGGGDRLYLLIVVSEEQLPPRAFGQVAFDATVLGITVVRVKNMAEAAALLAAMEKEGAEPTGDEEVVDE